MFHWILTDVVQKDRFIHIYDSMKGHNDHSFEILQLGAMMSTYLTMTDFFERKKLTDWSLLEAYKKKTDKYAFDIQYVDDIF